MLAIWLIATNWETSSSIPICTQCKDFCKTQIDSIRAHVWQKVHAYDCIDTTSDLLSEDELIERALTLTKIVYPITRDILSKESHLEFKQEKTIPLLHKIS